MSEKQLSIVIPVYNVEPYLSDCLDSIYDIVCVDYEVILIDDGSTDGSFQIMSHYQSLYPNKTVLIRQNNSGPSVARNAGIRSAKGEYLTFVDSDDYVDGTNLVKLLNNSIKMDLDIAVGNAVSFWKGVTSEKVVLSVPKKVIDLGTVSGIEFLENSFNAGFRRIECWNKIYRRDFILKNNLFFIENMLFEDVAFTFNAMFSSQKVEAFEIEYYFHRQRPGSIMTSENQARSEDRIRVVRTILSYFARYKYEKGCFDDYLMYKVWEHSNGTGDWNFDLCRTLIGRRKLTFKGWLRLLVVMLRMPKLLS